MTMQQQNATQGSSNGNIPSTAQQYELILDNEQLLHGMTQLFVQNNDTAYSKVSSTQCRELACTLAQHHKHNCISDLLKRLMKAKIISRTKCATSYNGQNVSLTQQTDRRHLRTYTKQHLSEVSIHNANNTL